MISPVKVWRNQKKVVDLIGQTGQITAYTVIRVPMAGFSEQAPYVVAVVKLKAGVQITVQVVDCIFDEIQVGQKIRLVARRIREPDPDGVIPYGLKAVLINEASQ